MGGKMKQSQRTKNNVRPSSSGRSAELLSNAGSAFSSLSVGSVGSPTKPLPALFPTLASLNSDQYLNADFLLCLKKLNKKDSITKTKALQELKELVNSSTVDDVIALLPYWTRAYRTLSTEPDHRVREATQVCHSVIVSRSGRALGPQLKQMLWWWLQAQYDSFPPAAAAAQRCLNSTFPEKKLPEAISFCKSEVMAQLLENFIGNTEASLQKKGESTEDVEIQYERILLSSLQGLQYFARHLTDTHEEWLWDQLKPLLDDKKYWKLANHKNAQIRAAWFSSVGVLIERRRQPLWRGHGGRLAAALMAGSKERDPLVAAPVWTAILLTMYHVQNWHEWMVDKKLLTKRIFDILENGGWGDAKHLSTMVLPLLAHLPSDLLTQQFYEAFFNALFAGLEKTSVLSSKSERQLWITSITDCLRYVSLQETDFAIEVTTSVHRTLLERILTVNQNVQVSSNLIKNTATSMVALVKYWLKQSKEGNSEKFDQLVRNYWQNIGSTVLSQIGKLSTDTDDIGRLIDGHILLLQTMKTSFSHEAKKKRNIKFDGDSANTAEAESRDFEISDVVTVERYMHNLNELAEKVCSYYFEFAEKKQVCSAVMTPLLTLIIEFDSKNLFTAIARHFTTNAEKELTIYELYDSVLKSWLAGDTMRCKSVVDVVFLMLKHMSDAEQDSLLDSFRQFPPSVVEICISLCLSHPHSSSPSVRRFMQSNLVEVTLMSVCKRLIDEADYKARNLLLMSLSHDSRGEMIISNETVSSILSLLSASLSQLESGQLEHTSSVSAQVLSSVATQGERHECRPLMLRIFYLNLVFKAGDKNLTLETYQECKSAWQDGLAALSHEKRQDFLNQAADIVKTRVADSKKKLNIPKIEHIACLCPQLIYNLNEMDPTDDIDDVTSLTELLFHKINSIEHKLENDQQPVEYYALRHDCIKSNLQCPFDDDNDMIKHIVDESSVNNTNELAKDNLIVFANKVLFRTLFLRAILMNQNCADDDEGVNEGDNKWCNSLLENQYLKQEFANIMFDYAIVNSLHEGYAFWQDYDLIIATKTRLDSVLDDVIAVTSPDNKSQILKSLANKAATDGYYWAYAARHYAVKCNLDENTFELEDTSNLEQVITGNGFYHTLQANTKSCTDLEIVHRAKFLLLLRGFYLAHAGEKEVLDEDLIRQLVASVPTCDVEVVLHAYHRHNHIMLYDRDITSASWLQVLSNAAILEYLTVAVEHKGWDNSAAIWDFTTITLCSLLSSLDMSKNNWGCTKVVLLTRSVLKLYTAVEKFISSVNEKSLTKQPSAHVAHLPTEWKDIFVIDITQHMYQLIMLVLDSQSTVVTSVQASALSSLCPPAPLPAPPRPPLSPTPAHMVARCARVLCAVSHHGYKYLAYHVLCHLDKSLVLEDVDKLSVWSNDAIEESTTQIKPQFSLSYFRDSLKHLHELVDAALSGVSLGEESCEVVPFSDSFSVSLGYLLLIEAMYRVCVLAKGDLIHQYIEHFREQKYAGDILSVCVRLLPAALCRADVTSNDLLQHAAMFNTAPAFTLDDPARSSLLSHLACRLVSRCCSGVSADSARSWRGAQSSRVTSLLSKTVAACVTPALVHSQLSAVQAAVQALGEDTEVTIHWSSQEVVVIHRVDDRPIELTITLARDHPLTLPIVATSGGPQHNTQWIAVYLSYQNGAVSDAIRMWTAAVTKRVEASPACYICYCRLHPATGTLPRTTCHQCRNKYHTVCLKKWFSTSNKSNCPLCRATF